jgi:curli production assembly/transport component CsgF
MRIAYAVVSIMLITPISWAGNMTFQFRNPNFGGNPNNGAFLLNEAQAQNSYKDPSLRILALIPHPHWTTSLRLSSRRF